jgi:glycosyltransferase involved in cell wall biosynthesis
MRLLFLTFYFRPDLSAGSFRATSLVGALSELGDGSAPSTTVLTTMPNRYSTFREAAAAVETVAGATVRRFPVRVHASGLLDQVASFLWFAWPALRAARAEPCDAVFATSSRLFTACLGAVVARVKRVPLYLDIRDIFVESIGPLLPRAIRWAAVPVLEAVESFTIRSATRVNLVSEGFRDYFEPRYPNTRFSYFTNGIDDEFIASPGAATLPAEGAAAGTGRPTVLYAGNIGEGQGLEQIVPGLARRLDGRFDLVVVGDGGRRAALEQAVRGLSNVRVMPPVKRAELAALYRDASVLFLHLNDLDAFRRVLPSKVFEYAATGKPILAGVAGHAAAFVLRHVENAVVFDPCDVDGAVRALERLRLAPIDRHAFVDRFARRRIAALMASDIVDAISTAAVAAGAPKR